MQNPNKDYVRTLRYARRSLGLCDDCGAPSYPYWRCAIHRKKARRNNLRYAQQHSSAIRTELYRIRKKMTRAQHQHILKICTTFRREATKKYKKGQEEHGGNLWDKSQMYLLDSAIEEAIDQVVYLVTLRDSMEKK